MNIASRFLTRADTKKAVTITVDGDAVSAEPNDTVAAAILAASGNASRHSIKGAPRTSFCMMGVCFECLVEIDGQPNSQACLVTVQEGMTVLRQSGSRNLSGEAPDA